MCDKIEKPKILVTLIAQEYGMTKEMMEEQFDPEKFEIIMEEIKK